MKKTALNVLRLAFGVAVLYLLLRAVGFSELAGAFAGIRLGFLLPALLIYFALFFLDAFKLCIVANSIQKVAFADMLKYFLFSNSLNLFVPGGVAYLSTGYFLRKNGFSFGQGAAVVIADKFIAFFVLAFFRCLGCGFSFLRRNHC